MGLPERRHGHNIVNLRLRKLLLLAIPLVSALHQSPNPHILHIVADDVGFNDLGFVNDLIKSPCIDGLRREGVALSRMYTSKDCAPSRGSIMTGRYPFHFGYYRNPSDEGGVMLDYDMLPAVLRRDGGYRTHAVGKWHLGFKNESFTPTFRGFDTFFGYYHWGEEYGDHVFPPYYKGDQPCRGFDLTNNSGPLMSPLLFGDDVYSTWLYVSEATRIINAHPMDQPLYLYLAFQNVHDPYETAPEDYVALYSEETDPNRRNYSALVTLLDDGVRNVTGALKRAGLLETTLVIFQTDNGGELPLENPTPELSGGAGNNMPLRGGKFTLWEGGVRTHAFVYSANTEIIPRRLRGTEFDSMVHVSDLYPTLLEAASLAIPADSGPYPLDGLSFWGALMDGSAGPRLELLHQPLNDQWNASCWQIDLDNPYSPACGAAITVWPYKLYYGYPGDNRTVELSVASAPSPEGDGHDVCTDPYCLFDISSDPEEAKDLVASKDGDMVAIAETLLARLIELSRAAPDPVCGDCTDNDPPSAEECAVVDDTGAWQPWE